MPPPASPPDPAAILAGLRKALAGRRPLTGDGDEPLFPKGAPGKRLVGAAVERGLLQVTKVTTKVAGKNKKIEYGELTEEGRKYVLAADDPKPILEALLPAVRALGASQTAAEIPETFRREVEKATATCQTAIETAYVRQQEAVTTALGRLAQSLTGALAPNGKNQVSDI